MTKTTKWIIGFSILFVIAIIAAPIYYYAKDFNDLPRSENPSDWGTFGDYFGGILNPIISFLTLIVTIVIAVNIGSIEKRNHEETVHSPVKPLFTIDPADFFSADMSHIGLTVEKDYYTYDVPTAPARPHDYLANRFYLKISNRGLGIATNIRISFELNLKELQSLLLIDETRIKTNISEETPEKDGRKFVVVNTHSPSFNYQGGSKIWNIERYGLGVAVVGQEMQAPIPSQIMTAFQEYNLIRRLRGHNEPFPVILVTFNYKNIHGKDLNARFRVGLVHRHDYPNYSLFTIFHEQL